MEACLKKMEFNPGVYVNKYRFIRYNFFRWRLETKIINKVILSLFLSCLTGVLAQFRFYLPGNQMVPVTGQTFAVLLSGVILGRWGGMSQMMYLGIGAAGVPWFTGLNGGIGVLTGATGGYLIGFIAAAFFIGYLTDRYVQCRKFINMLILMLTATFIIYIPGLTQLYLFYSSIGLQIGIPELLTLGATPFIPGDIVKAAAATAAAKIITPKAPYGSEQDTK